MPLSMAFQAVIAEKPQRGGQIEGGEVLLW
jgi:hypothetical protein